MQAKRCRGFTLIELMIVLAIMAILTMIAYPSYQGFVRKGQRASAQAYIGTLAQKQQQYFIDNRAYAQDQATLGYAAAPAEVAPYYTVAVAVVDGPPPSYTITATPKGTQAQDSCGTLSINSAGLKTASSGSKCW